MVEPGNLGRLVEVMHRLRSDCPWDAEQTHRTLVHYLVEETLEVVDAIESGDDAQLVEELGDLLLQVVFHAEIAAETGRFDIEAVAGGIADKLIARHPYVFAEDAVPADLLSSWEQRKKAEKGRSSALDGIPARMSSLTRAYKVIARARHHAIDVGTLIDSLDEGPGRTLLALVATAQEAGADPDQLLRDALRTLESQIVGAEQESANL